MVVTDFNRSAATQTSTLRAPVNYPRNTANSKFRQHKLIRNPWGPGAAGPPGKIWRGAGMLHLRELRVLR